MNIGNIALPPRTTMVAVGIAIALIIIVFWFKREEDKEGANR